MHVLDTTTNPSSLPTSKALTRELVSWWQDIFLLSVILSIFFSVLLGVRPLSVPDEARYSEIPREMIVTGDYVTPRLNTIKYFEKPALFYWIQAASIRSFGLSEWAVRLPTLILSILGCLMVYLTARTVFDRASGFLAGLMLSTSVLYFAMAHTITLDMALTVFLTGSLGSFLIAIDKSERLSRNLWLWSAYAFAALAVLTKGLVGIVLPMAIIGTWIIVCGQWKLLFKMNLFSGILLFLAITIPWHFIVQRANPEFFHFYFFEQQFLRYLTLYAKRFQPVWFFIPIFILGFFPWIVFLVQSLRHHWPISWKDRVLQKKPLFLMIWASVTFIFFSLSKSKLIPYIVPVFPPLAILVGNYLAAHLDKSKDHFRTPCVLLFWASIIISGVLLAIPLFDEVNDLLGTMVCCSLMATFLITGGYLIRFSKQVASLKSVLAILFLSMGGFLMLLNFAVAVVDTRSIRPLTIILNKQLKPFDEVVAYHHYYQDLPFYTQRRVTVVDCKGELAFGMTHQNTNQFMIGESTFWNKWHGMKQIYAIMSTSAYNGLKSEQTDLYLLGQTKDNVLVSNHAAVPAVGNHATGSNSNINS